MAAVRDLSRIRSSCLGEIILQLIASTDPLASDEDLGGGVHLLLRLECVHLAARTQDAIVYIEAMLLEQLLRPNAKRAGVIGQHHPVQGRAALFRHPWLLLHDELHHGTPWHSNAQRPTSPNRPGLGRSARKPKRS